MPTYPTKTLRKTAAFVIAVGLLMLSGRMLWTLKQPEREPKKTPVPLTIESWIYTGQLNDYMRSFEALHPQYHIEVRTFRSQAQLFEELSAAISANAAPDVAEIGGLYGVAQLADSGMIVPLDEKIGAGLWTDLHPAFVSQFTYKQYRWALPFGGEIPAMFYNADLAGHARLTFAQEGTSFPETMQAAKKMTLDVNGDGVTDHWGLAIDTDVPWYLFNWSLNGSNPFGDRDTVMRMLRSWQQLTAGYQVMEPSRHRFALSRFIDGKVGILISSSRKVLLLDQYIGGEFSYGIAPFPLFAGQNYVPNASGLVLLRTEPERERAALAMVNFFADAAVQDSLLRMTGKIPARRSVMERMLTDEKAEPWERTVLGTTNRLVGTQPNVNDIRRWERFSEIAERIELNSGMNLEWVAEELLEYIR